MEQNRMCGTCEHWLRLSESQKYLSGVPVGECLIGDNYYTTEQGECDRWKKKFMEGGRWDE